MRVISYYWIHPDDGMPQIDKTERSKESSEEKRRRFYVTDKRRKNMKNSNLFKKFAVMVVSAMMVITSFAMPTFAAKDTKITISGVESGATVTVYQVVHEVNGQWALVDEDTPIGATDAAQNLVGGIKSTTTNNVTKTEVIPTSDAVAAIASNPTSLGAGTKLDASGDTYVSKDNALSPGVYVVVVTETKSGTIYNPMVVSIDYENDGESEGVSADEPFTGSAVAKKSTPDIKKTTLDAENRYGDTDTAHGDSAQNNNPFVGDFPNVPANDRNAGTDFAGAVIPYKVVTTIPSYAKTYDHPQFIFTDALQTGFDGYVKYNDDAELVVYEKTANGYETLELGEDKDYWFVKSSSTAQTFGTETINVRDPQDDNYSIVDEKTFSIAFKVTPGEGARTICIVYKAKLSEACQSGLDPNTNEAKIEWTKNADDEDDFVDKDDCTHHYTFNIDGNVGGGETGKEIIKVGIDTEGNIITSEQELPSNWSPLKDAVFNIYKANDGMTAISTADNAVKGTATTDKDGIMNFNGLDAGKYVIKEITAPPGYALNETLIPVEIVPTFKTLDHHGKSCTVLESYTVTINKKYSNTYTVTEWNEDHTVKSITRSNNYKPEWKHEKRGETAVSNDLETVGLTTGIVNKTVGTLPSTGGIGTVVFTVGGIAIMALALFLLFGAKKKEQE